MKEIKKIFVMIFVAILNHLHVAAAAGWQFDIVVNQQHYICNNLGLWQSANGQQLTAHLLRDYLKGTANITNAGPNNIQNNYAENHYMINADAQKNGVMNKIKKIILKYSQVRNNLNGWVINGDPTANRANNIVAPRQINNTIENCCLATNILKDLKIHAFNHGHLGRFKSALPMRYSYLNQNQLLRNDEYIMQTIAPRGIFYMNRQVPYQYRTNIYLEGFEIDPKQENINTTPIIGRIANNVPNFRVSNQLNNLEQEAEEILRYCLTNVYVRQIVILDNVNQNIVNIDIYYNNHIGYTTQGLPTDKVRLGIEVEPGGLITFKTIFPKD